MAYSSTERQGIHRIGLIVSEELDWIFREQPIEDWGFDAEIEVVDGGTPTGGSSGSDYKNRRKVLLRR
jgi:hypothetical protein